MNLKPIQISKNYHYFIAINYLMLSLSEEEVGDTGIPAIEPKPGGWVTPTSKSPMGVIGGPQDDLTLRASLYGVVFQSYADRGEWESGLRSMDQAISDMPRTNHRLLIFKVYFNYLALFRQNCTVVYFISI